MTAPAQMPEEQGAHSQSAHEEDGHLVPVQPFDWDTVDEKIFGPKPEIELADFTQEDVDRALTVLRALLQWIWQCGMKNTDGVKIRAIVVCWIFLKELRPLTLTQLSRGYGMKKQSIGRWVDEFKNAFPAIRTPHMRPNTK